MTDLKIQARACEDATWYYACPNGFFTGCCSHNPCEQGICNDQAQGLEQMDDIERRDVVTTTITKLLARDSGSESTITTTKTCTVTVTSTVYNTLTITSASSSTSSLAPVNPNLAALKSVAVAASSLVRPSSASTGQSTTKTSTHTSSVVTATKALIPVSNNVITTSKLADAHNAGRIAGITLGSLAGATLIGLLIFLCCRRRRRSKETSGNADLTLSVPDTPAIESGGKRKFIFGSRRDHNSDKTKTIGQQRNEQLEDVSNGTFFTRTASHLSQVHPLFRPQASLTPTANSNPNQNHQTNLYANPDLLIASDASRFYSTSDQNRDASTGSHMTAHLPTIGLARASTKKSKEVNLIRSPISGDPNQYTYDPKTLTVPTRDHSDNRSINSSISPTPTSMVGSVFSSPVEGDDTGKALTSSVYAADQSSPSYILPSQRPGRQITPSVWTDATIPFTPTPGLPQFTTPRYTAYRPTLPTPPPPPSSLPALSSSSTPGTETARATIKRKPIMHIATSGTTTESDILSPRHQMQEPTRRRKSLFQTPGELNNVNDGGGGGSGGDEQARNTQWI